MTIMKCPGQDMRHWKPGDIFEVAGGPSARFGGRRGPGTSGPVVTGEEKVYGAAWVTSFSIEVLTSSMRAVLEGFSLPSFTYTGSPIFTRIDPFCFGRK